MARMPVAQARRIIAEGLPYGPRTHPCVCGAGRHAHSGKHLTGGCKDTGCTRYRAHPAYELAYRALDAQATTLVHALRDYDARERAAKSKANPRGEGEWSVGPSDAGTCRRALWYRNLPPEDYTPAPVDAREARMGAIIHAEAVRRLAALYPWQSFEQEVRVGGLDRPAYYDRYDPIVCEVEDIKTAGDWRWDVVTDHGVDDDVWDQGLLYGLALTEDGYPVKTVKITYLKRCNGHDQVFVRDYDHEAALAARDRLIAIATALDYVHTAVDVDLDEVLPRDRTGPSTDALCRRCPARRHCWNMSEAEDAGRSPESFTILGPEPADPEVEWALLNAVEKREAKTAAKNAYDEANALIDGIEPRRYGSAKVHVQTYGGGPDYKGFHERVQNNLQLPPDQQTPIEDIGLPYRQGSPTAIAKRVAKSILEREARVARQQAAAPHQHPQGGAA